MTEITNYLTQIQLSKLERYKLVFRIPNFNKAQENLILCKLTQTSLSAAGPSILASIDYTVLASPSHLRNHREPGPKF